MDKLEAIQDRAWNENLGSNEYQLAVREEVADYFDELFNNIKFDTTFINRFEVITPTGRAYVNNNVAHVVALFQDNNETLKIIIPS